MSRQLIEAAKQLSRRVDALRFAAPVSTVYNPLAYAWAVHRQYLQRFGRGRKRVVFLGMNPGPFGMVQCGVPFGEIAAVRDWMGLSGRIGRPADEHPKRPILGWDCSRSEVSGRRLWGYIAERFGTAEDFFAEHFVLNYCPLAFCAESGANITPDKLAAAEREAIEEHCDAHLRRCIEILAPEWLVGVGGFARKQAERACGDMDLRFGTVLHPSPASPAANRGWATAAEQQLIDQGIVA